MSRHHDAQIHDEKQHNDIINKRNDGRVRNKLFSAPKNEREGNAKTQHNLPPGSPRRELETPKRHARADQWDGRFDRPLDCTGPETLNEALGGADNRGQNRHGQHEPADNSQDNDPRWVRAATA